MNEFIHKILVVDDNETNIDILVEALEDAYDIRIATDGKRALKTVLADPPDLILLDIMMPEMDGYEVCEILKQNETTKKIPVIFLTALTEEQNESKGLALGAIDYIKKPFSPDIVRARVQNHLEREIYKNHLEELIEFRTTELNETKEALRVANNAKGNFLMNMSHELRTPLNGILMASELLPLCDSKSEIEEIQEIIHSSSNALLQSVEKILEFTGSKNGEVEIESSTFQLDEALAGIETHFFHKGTNIELIPVLDIDSESITNSLIGDKERLIEILNHLLENAAKFTTSRPETVLRIRVTEKSPEDANIEFSIADKGIGIKEEHFEQIYEPFFQADTSTTRQYDGIGIGLSVCKQLVELMDGKIWVESKPDLGSTFYFTIRCKRQDNNVPFDKQLLKW
ncbi:ATP-binding protein [Desulfobacterales bacterium HSG17]|nr:ATP-binding protein [Desulfobacterales bacterium HSG17]